MNVKKSTMSNIKMLNKASHDLTMHLLSWPDSHSHRALVSTEHLYNGLWTVVCRFHFLKYCIKIFLILTVEAFYYSLKFDTLTGL